jgi:uncharacterized repeat protein (TIGR04076 family)
MKNKYNLSLEEMQILEDRKATLKKKIGITDEDFETYISFPHNRNLSLRRNEINQYKIIAEVVESKYCNAGLKTGQKYVFSVIPNKLLLEESDAPLCLKALGSLSQSMKIMWDRLIAGIDPNSGSEPFVVCPDIGISHGGIGTIVFKLYAVKKD